MIAKIVQGRGFRGAINYVMDKKNARLLFAEGVRLKDKASVIQSFITQSKLKPKISKPVAHISLDFSAQNKGRLTDKLMIQLSINGASVNPNSNFYTEEITALMHELRNHLKPKQFSPEQIKELQKSMAQISAYSLNKISDNIRGLSTELKASILPIEENVEQLKTPQNTVIRKEHVFTVDFRNSKAAITIISMALIILLSLGGNIWQFNRNIRLRDNDLKYRYIKMEGKASSRDLLRLETIFSYDRNRDSISVFREQVEKYERLVKEHVGEFKRKALKNKEHT